MKTIRSNTKIFVSRHPIARLQKPTKSKVDASVLGIQRKKKDPLVLNTKGRVAFEKFLVLQNTHHRKSKQKLKKLTIKMNRFHSVNNSISKESHHKKSQCGDKTSKPFIKRTQARSKLSVSSYFSQIKWRRLLRKSACFVDVRFTLLKQMNLYKGKDILSNPQSLENKQSKRHKAGFFINTTVDTKRGISFENQQELVSCKQRLKRLLKLQDKAQTLKSRDNFAKTTKNLRLFTETSDQIVQKRNLFHQPSFTMLFNKDLISNSINKKLIASTLIYSFLSPAQIAKLSLFTSIPHGMITPYESKDLKHNTHRRKKKNKKKQFNKDKKEEKDSLLS